MPTTSPDAAPRRPRWRRLRTIVLLVILLVAVNEACVAGRANRLASTVPTQNFAGMAAVWTEHDAIAEWSFLGGLGVRDLQSAIARQTLILAERHIANYRTPAPSVREAQWLEAAEALRHALGVAPNDAELRGALRYVEGHLHRINGEANKDRRGPQAQETAKREFADAVTAFRDAAELRPNWPDPFLGLARTFIVGLEDIDRGADALSQAQKFGFVPGTRETALLADGYRVQGETLQNAAKELVDLPQAHDLLVRAATAYRRALEEYSKIANLPDVPARIKLLHTRLDLIDRRLSGGGGAPGLPPGGQPWA